MTTETEQPGQPAAAKPKSQMMVIRDDIEKMAPQFAAALPAHIPADRFVRTAITAIQLNPDIAGCVPRTIYAACMKAAQDGLVIDGREAALVKFNTKMKVDGVERWVDVAQYMPMVQGILKKARNSGEISYISARVVYDRDTFTVVYGDEESLTHVPYLDGDPGQPRLAYMVAKLKDGQIVREIMTKAQIEKVRQASRSKDKGPWVAWPEEMWRKTVIRRGAKYLPTSSDRQGGADVIDLVARDDAMFEAGDDQGGEPQPTGTEPAAEPRKTRQQRQPRQSTGGAGAKLNDPPAGQQDGPTDLVEWTDPATGEVHMLTPADIAARTAAADAGQQKPAQQQAPAQPAQQPAASAAPSQPAAQPQQQATKPAPQQDNLDLPPHLDRRGPPARSEEPPPPTLDDVI